MEGVRVFGLLRPAQRSFVSRARSAINSPCCCATRALSTTAPRWQTPRRLPYDPKPALDANGKIPSMPYIPDPLVATAPAYKAHIIVHPHSRSRPEDSWPPAIESVSPIISELGSRCKTGASLEGYGVSFSEGELRAAKSSDSKEFPDWDNQVPKMMRPLPSDPTSEEQCLLYVYLPPGKYATVGPLSLQTLDEGKPLAEKILDALAEAKPQTAKRKAEDETHVYVCTHGTRDCRCGVVGNDLLKELKSTFAKEDHASGNALKPTKFFSISHVGGHKWAANALVYPHGDWYGNLRSWDSPLLLRAAQAPASSMHDLQDVRERMVHWSRWRGRIGMTEEKMMQHYEHWGPPLTMAAVIKPAARTGRRAASAPGAASASTSEEVPLRFRSFEGEWFELTGKVGETLKDVAKRHNLPSIEATCGGKCECATCHAYLAPAASNPKAAGHQEASLPAAADQVGDEEMDMLDYALSRKATSRLTCQVKVTKELSDWMMQSGGRVDLPRF